MNSHTKFFLELLGGSVLYYIVLKLGSGLFDFNAAANTVQVIVSWLYYLAFILIVVSILGLVISAAADFLRKKF
jgi:hypothetical protein